MLHITHLFKVQVHIHNNITHFFFQTGAISLLEKNEVAAQFLGRRRVCPDSDVFGNYSDSRLHKDGSLGACCRPAFLREELAHPSFAGV